MLPLLLLSDIHPLATRGIPATIAIGIFDGVHRGHQQVLRSAMERAKDIGGEAWALTFEPHPLAVLAPKRLPPRLTSLEVRHRRFEALGLDGCVTLPFTRELAGLSPADFFRNVLCPDGWRPDSIFAGANWRFGADGAGSLATLASLGGRVETVPHVLDAGEVISSTRIRTALQCGDIATANRLLGYEYVARGVVVEGRKVGRTLGFPTANVQVGTLLPDSGVYAVRVRVEGTTPPFGHPSAGGELRRIDGHPSAGGEWRGVANIGTRPTFRGEGHNGDAVRHLLEVHLLDFEGDLYGAMLDVALVTRLRDERAFASPEALATQIRADVQAARESL